MRLRLSGVGRYPTPRQRFSLRQPSSDGGRFTFGKYTHLWICAAGSPSGAAEVASGQA